MDMRRLLRAAERNEEAIAVALRLLDNEIEGRGVEMAGAFAIVRMSLREATRLRKALAAAVKANEILSPN